MMTARRLKAQGAHTCRNPQEVHPTGEFVIVTYTGGRSLLCFTSSLMTVIRQAGR